MNRLVNNGTVKYVDQHLSHTAEMIRSGALPPIDIAVIEATAITGEGHIVPSSSVGNSNIFAQYEHDVDVIVTEQGLADLRGLHPRGRTHTPCTGKGLVLAYKSPEGGVHAVKKDGCII